MRKKWIIIISICLSVVLVCASLTVMIVKLTHKHKLGDDKVYHIYNDRVYYTRQCLKDGHTQSFETEATTFADVLKIINPNDSIVVEENIASSEILKITSTISQDGSVQQNIVNINLNNKELFSTFELTATYGTIKLNISNGTIRSSHKNAIKASGENGEVEINIRNVNCYASGEKNAPLYVEDVNKVAVNAWDSEFISQNDSLSYGEYGVGVFLNEQGDFRFENCRLEGGDGLHVRNGKVSLVSCDLVNTGLTRQPYQSVDSGFSAVGASLSAHCYTSGTEVSNFEIVVEDCVMTANNSNRVIYVYKVAKEGYVASLNPNSSIIIKS